MSQRRTDADCEVWAVSLKAPFSTPDEPVKIYFLHREGCRHQDYLGDEELGDSYSRPVSVLQQWIKRLKRMRPAQERVAVGHPSCECRVVLTKQIQRLLEAAYVVARLGPTELVILRDLDFWDREHEGGDGV